MKPITMPILAILIVIALVVGAVGGYLVSNRTSNNTFSSYTDNYGGPIQDSQSGFVTNAPLVAGFTRNQTTGSSLNGQIAWYWLVGGTSASVNPVYFFNYQNGAPVQGQYPIIDMKPGDTGYTHFWEINNVTVPSTYTPNTIKSLATLNSAKQAGLVTIKDAGRSLNGPLVAHNVKISVVNGEPAFQPVWYRTDIATMAVFETNLLSGGPPAIGIWLIQRDGDSCPLLEAVCGASGTDINHDGDVKDSNDLIDTYPGQPGYSPLWAVSILHVYNSTYHPNGSPYPISISSGFPSPFPQHPVTLSANGMFTSLEQAQADQAKTNPTYVDLTFSGSSKGVTSSGNLVNCPTLPLGIEPSSIAFS